MYLFNQNTVDCWEKLSTPFESQQCIISTTKRLIVAKRIVVNGSYILLLRFVCERQRFIKLNVKGQEDKRFGVAEGSRAEVAPPTDRVINMGVIPWQAHKHRDSKTLVSIASNLAALLVICFMARNREEISRLETASWRSAPPESGQTLIWVTIFYIVPTKRKLLNLNKILRKNPPNMVQRARPPSRCNPLCGFEETTRKLVSGVRIFF